MCWHGFHEEDLGPTGWPQDCASPWNGTSVLIIDCRLSLPADTVLCHTTLRPQINVGKASESSCSLSRFCLKPRNNNNNKKVFFSFSKNPSCITALRSSEHILVSGDTKQLNWRKLTNLEGLILHCGLRDYSFTVTIE